MKREGTIGAATFLAIAAVVGISLQTGPKQVGSSGTDRNVESKRSKASITKRTYKERPGCTSLQEELESFLAIKNLILPRQCYQPEDAPHGPPHNDLSEKTPQLKFVIALMPDPVHTHSSALFDQFAVAIQEGAQDEGYDFDSSWLPWDDEESSYALLDDEKTSNREKEFKESQPGIILFRKTPVCPEDVKQKGDCKEEVSRIYGEGLVVFVVGEEATHGIHGEQFSNALKWIVALQPRTDGKRKRLAILGPTFSGSFSSVAQALSDPEMAQQLDLDHTRNDQRLAIYSGSVSGNDSARLFQNTFNSEVIFHSFVQSDEESLRRFCKYITTEQPGFDPGRLAVISEDETAYGASGMGDKTGCVGKALNLYYPRDISALRAAYQTRSLFDVGTSSQSAETQRRNLPSDLADPAGKVHDSIRSYGGGQTPLSQEAYLMELVAALRELHARYILLRSSNTLDQLFLANFLRRSYPDGRIVILGSDLMFIRERGSTGLSGTMTLSTYPLFPLERDWTEHQSLPASDRTFSADTAEGTYVAFRLLLNSKRLNDGNFDSGCHLLDEGEDKGQTDKADRQKNENAIFVPPVFCTVDPPIPDYSPPFWTLDNQCGEVKTDKAAKIADIRKDCPYPGPATWLSVIGVNRFWPMASLTQETPQDSVGQTTIERQEDRENDPGGRPEMPLGMKVFLLALVGFSLFHAWCCWSGSYTAKPVFRAHFASTGEWPHILLVFGGSCCIAFLAIVAGWGSAVFSTPPGGLVYPWLAFFCVAFVWLMAWGAVLAHSRNAWKLAKGLPNAPNLPRMTDKRFATWNYQASGLFVVATLLFCLVSIVPLWRAQLIENGVMNYWRAMHLASGVSPIVPILSILIGLYLSFWFTLHGLALFGPDRPCLPPTRLLALKDKEGNTLKDEKGNDRIFLRMFSQEDAAARIEQAATPWNWKIVVAGSSLFVLFAAVGSGISGGVPVRSLGSQSYSVIFLLGLDICCSLSVVEACRLYHVWDELRRLLAFLDRLPLRRTLAVLRGFSWGSVWKMSGNVLEVRYKVISRQMECMNHAIATLQDSLKTSSSSGSRNSLAALLRMRRAGLKFAGWYSTNYLNVGVGDLRSFTEFQEKVAVASGILLTQLLLPAWRAEGISLLVAPAKDEKEEAAPNPPPLAADGHIRNAEEFVCLNYLSFIQNVLGRLRTMAMTIIALFVASACAMSSYPFDPRQALSAVLVALFVIGGAVIVKVYADMHRDATLSHVTNTKPGELGQEFWFKIVGFGFAPLIGLLTRIFPGMTDFIFSWLQPGISSLK
jgi:hypothetical protein